MFKTDWLQVIRPLMKDSGAAHPRSRKRFEGFNLPSTAHDWSDDQAFAYKAIRDGLGIDALKAEQYVNTHTDPKKPSGHANIFYPATEPTSVEFDIAKRFFPKIDKIDPDLIMRLPHPLDDNHAPQKRTLEIPDVRKLNPARVQLLSKSGHGMRDGGQNDRATITDADTLPLFDGVAALGKQTNNEQQAIKIAQANGLGGAQSTGQVNQQSQQVSPRPNFMPKIVPPKTWLSRPKLTASKSYNIPNGVDPDDWGQIRSFYKEFEGEHREPYLDSVGKVTVGFGRMTPDFKAFSSLDWETLQGQRATPQEVKAAWNTLMAERAKGLVQGNYEANLSANYFKGKTGLQLADGASDELLAQEYAYAEQQGLKIIPGPLPKEARHIVTDMVYNMGASGFANQFPILRNVLTKQGSDWLDKASKQVSVLNVGPERNDYRRQVFEELHKAFKATNP